jgi:hypothetical protein
MPSVIENRNTWTTYDWGHRGENWSSGWGGSETIWFGSLLPRLHAHLPASRLLEIAPGFGRMTQYLLSWCGDYVGIDVTERCVKYCRRRFVDQAHARFLVNDGVSLDMLDDDSLDFAFSWDSLVHAERDVLEAYVTALGRKLKPGAGGFIHHSNIGAYLEGGQLNVPNDHWRAPSMTAALFREFCRTAGLRCVAQELIGWGQGPVLNDAFSYFVRDEAHVEIPATVVERPDFFINEVPRLRDLRQLYGIGEKVSPPPSTPAPRIVWTRDASAICDAVDEFGEATCEISGETVTVLSVELGTDGTLFGRAAAPGDVLKVTPHAIVVQSGRGTVVLRQLVFRGLLSPAPDVLRQLGAGQIQ